MRVQLILCDHCQAVQGKLYVMGGGWTHANPAPDSPTPMAVAAIINIDWNQANRPFDLSIRLIDEDGSEVIGPDSKPVRVDGKAESGRPPGIPSGSELNSIIALNIGPMLLAPGGYAWVAEINGNEEARTSFWIVAPA
jgi:hypothetical protein